MFGFRNRRRYNGTVDTKLNNEYGIKTHEDARFPGASSYLGLIDVGWETKHTEDECALTIATMFAVGLMRNGDHHEAIALKRQINEIVMFGIPRGMFNKDLVMSCGALLDEVIV